MTRTCLVVDDSMVTRKVGRSIVESFGFSCAEAADGIKALDYCLRSMPEVILLDWNMPEMTGYDFLVALRDLPQGKKPIIIFCTAQNDTMHIARAMERGANEYIIKPFSSDIVRDKFLLTGLLDD